MNELVSIIVPVYNVKNYLEQCITSILQQTYTNLEIILVDDGSTDGSGVICDRFAQQDARIKLLHQNNQGLTKARKNGAKLVTGKYLGFVDSDDYIDQDLYQKLMRTSDDFDLLIQNWFRNEENVDLPRGDHIAPGIYASAADMDFILQHMVSISAPGGISNLKSGFVPFVWNKLYKTEIAQTVFKEIDEDLRLVEDCDFTYRYFLKCKSVIVSDICGYHYRIRSDSLCHAVDTDGSFLLNVSRLYNGLLPVFHAHPKANIIVAELQAKTAAMLEKIPNRMGFPPEVRLQFHSPVFPFMNLLDHKSIALYGGGRLGQAYRRQILKLKACYIDVWVDKDWAYRQREGWSVLPVETLKNSKYDYVVIAVSSGAEAERIKQELCEMGINEERLLWKEPAYIY